MILQSLFENRPIDPGPGLIIHMGNARAHISRKAFTFCLENHLGMALHPTYSPDLALSDFFLFGHVKHARERAGFPSEETLLAIIQSRVSDLPIDTLMALFVKWVKWLRTVT
jgi:hypothetical protein